LINACRNIAMTLRLSTCVRASLVALAIASGVPSFAQQAAPDAVISADVAAEVAKLSDTLMLGPMMDVMRLEGLTYGASIEDEMFPGAGGAGWAAAVVRIYDAGRMRAAFDQSLTRHLAMDPGGLPDMLAFFGSPVGQRALSLELEARRTLLDKTAEEAARQAWENLRMDGGARHDQIMRFAAVNDLVESNVMGALNANLAFYHGLAASGAYGDVMTEDQMLSDVWAQEDSVRSDTEDWLYPFLALAYGPMSDADLDAYIAFSETKAGKQLNAALFAAFDDVFTEISGALGLAAAGQLQGEDI
jgi:hypothetical protein